MTAPILWRPSQYVGTRAAVVAATQLEDRLPSAAERRRILVEWIEFLSGAPTQIRDLEFVSRVPQDLLDAVAGQPQLERLVVKWGPYRDASAVGAFEHLAELRLRGATALERLDPLLRLPNLTSLTVSQAHRLDSIEPLGELAGLEHLVFGNEYPGDDRSVAVHDLRWVGSLPKLRTLALPGIRLLDPDLTPILALPQLEELHLPLRRGYRKQVFEFAAASPVFAGVARDYEKYEAWRATL